MNRFSPKQTLSNIATAVQVTVDSVNKVFGAFAFAMIVLPSTSSAQSASVDELMKMFNANGAAKSSESRATLIAVQNDQIALFCKPGGPMTDAANCASARVGLDSLLRNGASDPTISRCDKNDEEISKATERARENCDSVKAGSSSSSGSKTAPGAFDACVSKVSYCADADIKVSEYNEESEGPEYCSSILANKCPALDSFMTGRDYRAEKREADADRKEAKKTYEDLLDDDRKDKKDIADQQQKLNEQLENSALAFRRKQDDLSKKMTDSLEGVDASAKKALSGAQEAANQMEVEYVKMRSEQRAAADMVAQAEDDLQLMCRQSAEKSFNQAEEKRKAAEKKGRKNLGTAVSGATKRNKAIIARQQLIDYQAFFSQCTSGSSADGVGGANRIATAKRAKESADKLIAEKAQLIEKQRAQMQQKLSEMEKDATNQKSKIIEDIQKEFTNMNEEKALVDKQNTARMGQMANNNLQANLSTQTKLQTANQELMKTQSEAALAVSRYDCAGRKATRSDSRSDKVEKGYGSAIDSVRSLDQACTKRATLGCPTESRPTICASATTAIGIVNSGKIKNALDIETKK